jgi:hypothetical protein
MGLHSWKQDYLFGYFYLATAGVVVLPLMDRPGR